MLAILPEIDQQSLYNALNHDLAGWHPANATVARQSLEVYLCPSAPRANELFPIDVNGPVLMAYSNYVGNLGSDYLLDYMDLGKGMQPDGVLFRDSNVRLRDIEDGTSHTLMAGEREHPDYLLHPVWALGATGKVVAYTSLGIQRTGEPKLHWGFTAHHVTGAHFLMADGSVRLIGSNADRTLLLGLSTRMGHEDLREEF
jgi:hypothetical protein